MVHAVIDGLSAGLDGSRAGAVGGEALLSGPVG
jgi:hypothetical protein